MRNMRNICDDSIMWLGIGRVLYLVLKKYIKEVPQADLGLWSSFTEQKPLRFKWIINSDPIEGGLGRQTGCYWVSMSAWVPSHSLPLGQCLFLSTWLAGWAHAVATEFAQSGWAKTPFCESLGRICALKDVLMGSWMWDECLWKTDVEMKEGR